MNISRQDILKLFRQKKLDSRIHQIFVDNTRTIHYQDIFEFILCISGCHRFHWNDKTNLLSKQPLFIIFFNLLKDIVLWPFIYLFHVIKVAILANYFKRNKSIKTKRPYDKNLLLFLRTDHWFNVISGGSVGHLSGVINGFRSLGIRVQVTSSDYLVGVEKNSNFDLCRPHYKLGRNLPVMPELNYNNLVINDIKKKIKHKMPFVIYQRYSFANYVGVYFKAKFNIPYICEYNGSFVWMKKNWGNGIFHESLITDIELLNLNAADIIVVVSQASKDELLARGIKEEKILVNPNGVNPNKYSPEISAKPVIEKYDLSHKIVVGFIGTFEKWHGVVEMARSIIYLYQSFPELSNKIRFLLIGDGIMMPEVQSIIDKSLYRNNVIFTGNIPQNEGPSYLSACDIFLSPHVKNPDGTKFFGSPTKLFEYMSMKKAIIASNLEQIGDVLEHKKTAYLVQPGDIKALSNAIAIVATNKELRTQLGENARKKVLEKYTWELHVKKIIERFQTIQTS